jgi:hypothetical protein
VLRGKVSLFRRWTMRTTLPDRAYPRVLSDDDFSHLVSVLEKSPIEANPDIQVTYQATRGGVRVLAVGSMNDSAREITQLLRSNPEYASGIRVRRIREPKTASCFY